MKMRATGQSVAAHVGCRIRQIRTEAGMTLEHLAEVIGARVEELYRHEQGVEPVSPLRLLALSAALDTPIPGFFAGLNTGGPGIAGLGTAAQDIAERPARSMTREPAAPPASGPDAAPVLAEAPPGESLPAPDDGLSSDLARRALAHAAEQPGYVPTIDVITAFVQIPNRDLRRDLLQVLRHFC
jgi:transcriptional regulator with XRE-family HTH domain